jgi:hypothetical protein
MPPTLAWQLSWSSVGLSLSTIMDKNALLGQPWFFLIPLDATPTLESAFETGWQKLLLPK